ncbi:MAG: T9SS type A sorting domain-containing protein [Flavobacteriales bacterium]
MATAQTWCPPGATWWYDYYTNTGGIGYAQATFVADTLVAGVSAHKITAHVEGIDQSNQQPISYDLPPLFTAMSGDAVMLWTGSSFDTLFHYGAAPGDQWVPAGTGALYTVLDTGTTLIDGQPLRWWAVDIGGFFDVSADTIFERMGGLHVFLRPAVILAVTDPEIWGLRCYQDSQLDYSANNAPACNFILALNEHAKSPGIALFPNPGSHGFEVLSSHALGSVSVRDISGRAVLSRTTGNMSHVNASAWLPGCYVVEVEYESGYGTRHRWVKQ